MIIACPSCKKKFEVDASLIPDKGKMLQCGSCDYKWFFKKGVNKKIIEEPKKEFIKKEKKQIDKISEITDKNVPDSTEELITEAETAISKKGNEQIKIKKINIFSFLILLIITFAALIILADTFKGSIKLFIPGFDKILISLFETLKDIVLFIKDLFN